MGADSLIRVRGRYLIFRLASQTYAIPVGAIQEIVPMAELARVVGAPAFLDGFLDVGGDLIAVVSLRRLFGLSDRRRDLYTPIVILHSGGQRIALVVDSVCEIADIADEDAVALGEGYALNDFAHAAAQLNRTTVLLVSPERLLLEEERRRLTALSEIARDRCAALEASVP